MKVSKQKMAKGNGKNSNKYSKICIFKEKYGKNVIKIHYVGSSIVLMMVKMLKGDVLNS